MANGLIYTNRLNLDHSLALYQRAVAVIPGATQTRSKRPTQYALGAYPIYLDHTQGSHVWDVDGHEYIDYVLACGPILLGYNYPAVSNAIQKQLERGIIYGQLSPLEVEAAEAIVEAVPCAEMVRFFKGGAEANAAAVRIARGYTGREKVASAGYRGWHDQWAIVEEGTRRGIPQGLRDYTLPFQYGDLASLEGLFAQNPGQVAAVILEPATVDGGSAEFLVAVRDLAHAQGALLIYDEVVTGFRLARGGAQAYFNVIPDLAVFAKAVANGMPLAVVAGRREVMALAADLFITLTYGDESLSLAAAVASLSEMRTKDVHGTLWRIGQRLMDGLDAAAEEAGVPLKSRGLAPMSRLALDGEAVAPYGVTPAQVWTFLLQEMARRGVLWRPGGINFVTYSHTEADVDYTVRMAGETFLALREALDKGQLLQRTWAGKQESAFKRW
ncbi:MAG: aminotransferase class III-fold pyridoxal phosphate-dependent enzyme [Anaerolineae bacterium]|nr:aminotransferase class III-fold pyridoxal phosphate-dependent enzyme [Anaerolineae bacterium]